MTMSIRFGGRHLVPLLFVLGCATSASAQGVVAPPGKISFMVGAGSVSPAPYWKSRWSTSGIEHVDASPEFSGAVSVSLSRGKSVEIGVSRWRVRLQTDYGGPLSGYFESRTETQDVRAFETNWLKRFGTGRAAFFAGGGVAISFERDHLHVTTSTCGLAVTCLPYDATYRHVAKVGQGMAGVDFALSKRLRTRVAYRVQARNVGGFEFGGVYHGVSAGVLIALR
jgi:hypothetical protein